MTAAPSPASAVRCWWCRQEIVDRRCGCSGAVVTVPSPDRLAVIGLGFVGGVVFAVSLFWGQG